ncbi:MAG: rane protein [Paenibacillus sp.]|jgi:hypothetical protein|nr:rane protein [Paenibacillus sp.]
MLEQLASKGSLTEANGKPERETLLLLIGIIGIVLGAVCSIFMFVQGNHVPPHGEWMKPVTFNLAVGFFILTTALIVPHAGFRRKGRSLFRTVLAITMLYWYGIETIQTSRGVDPRFGDGSFLKDELPAIVFGGSSVLVTVLYLILLFKLFSGKRLLQRPLLVLGIRYGLSTVMLGFASGFWMAVLESRIHSHNGGIMSIHVLGFHAFQAIPMIAWLLEHSRHANSRTKLLVHAAGGSWLIAVGCATLQVYVGKPPLQLTFYSVLGLICLLLWFSILVYASVLFRKARSNRGKVFPLILS